MRKLNALPPDVIDSGIVDPLMPARFIICKIEEGTKLSKLAEIIALSRSRPMTIEQALFYAKRAPAKDGHSILSVRDASGDRALLLYFYPDYAFLDWMASPPDIVISHYNVIAQA